MLLFFLLRTEYRGDHQDDGLTQRPLAIDSSADQRITSSPAPSLVNASCLCYEYILVTLGGGWDWRFPGCMCEGMPGGMCAGVVCEDILFCTMSVLRSRNCTLGGWSVREECASTWRSLPLGHVLCGAVLQIFRTCTLSTCMMWRPTICR